MAHCRKTQLSIFLTTRCNLKCRYCYVGEKQDNAHNLIDFKFVKRGILDFFKRYESREIRFLAIGEPTTAFPLMRDIKDWVFGITDGDCKFELQTNGYFSRKIYDWVAKNIDIIWISCDGPPDIQNFYRPTPGGRPSSDLVEGNIRLLNQQVPVLGCRATIGAKNIKRQIEMIDYFAELGVRVIMSDPIFAPVKNYQSPPDGLEKIDLLQYAEHFLEARNYASKKGVFYGSIFSVNFDEETEYFCRSCIPYPHLTTDGYVTCCDMAFSGSDEKMKELVYGKYIPKEDRIEYNKLALERIRSRKAGELTHCQGCEVLYNCAGACLGEALNETGSIFGIKPEVCKAIKYLAKHMPLNEGLYPYLHP